MAIFRKQSFDYTETSDLGLLADFDKSLVDSFEKGAEMIIYSWNWSFVGTIHIRPVFNSCRTLYVHCVQNNGDFESQLKISFDSAEDQNYVIMIELNV